MRSRLPSQLRRLYSQYCGSVTVVYSAYGSFCGIHGSVNGVYSSVCGSVDSNHGLVHGYVHGSVDRVHGSVDGVRGSVDSAHVSVDGGHGAQCLSGVPCSHDRFHFPTMAILSSLDAPCKPLTDVTALNACMEFFAPTMCRGLEEVTLGRVHLP